jgi:hypothetical protein
MKLLGRTQSLQKHIFQFFGSRNVDDAREAYPTARSVSFECDGHVCFLPRSTQHVAARAERFWIKTSQSP